MIKWKSCALIGATRTEFIERAVYLLTVEINKEIEHGC